MNTPFYSTFTVPANQWQYKNRKNNGSSLLLCPGSVDPRVLSSPR